MKLVTKWLIVAVGCIFSLAPKLHAQFYSIPSPNLQIITNSVANQAFNDSVRDSTIDQGAPAPLASEANPALLRFVPNLANRQRNLTGFVAKTRKLSGESADQMEALFASTDIFAAIALGLAPMGLRVDNVADAYTVYWVTAWEASRGISGTDSPRAQAQAVKAQSARALLSTPEFTRSSPAQKQELTEALLIQTAMISAAMEGATHDSAQKIAVGQAVRTGAKAMGLDLDAVTLTPAGFKPVR